MPLPTNPYGKSPSTEIRVSGRVSPADYQYFNTLFPHQGIQSNVIATLFHTLCARLRAAGLRAGELTSHAWSIDHPSYDTLNAILTELSNGGAGVSGGATGRPAGMQDEREVSPPDEPGGVGSIYQTLCSSPLFSPNPQGSDPSRSWGAEEKGITEKGQCEPSGRTPETVPGEVTPEAERLLRKLGLIK